MNNYILLCLIALVAIIRTMPTVNENINNPNSNSSDYDENKNILISNILQNDQHLQTNTNTVRYIHSIIDGKTHYIKAAGVTYHQRLRDNQCLVEYNGQYLMENNVLQLRKKLYRVENCLLERVFHACGPNLLLMLNLVCRVVENYQTTTPITNSRRQSLSASTIFLHQIRPRANKIPRVITESCCENLCTITELTRYCHR